MIPILFGVLIFLILPPPAFADSTLLINEILPYPSSGEKEWIEFFNPEDQSQQISGYKLTEETASGNTVIHSLPEFTLTPTSTCYYQFSTNSLNNDQDTVTLLDSNNIVLDSYSYQKTVQNKSFARIPDGSVWSAEAAPSRTGLCGPSEVTSSPSPQLNVKLWEFMPNPTKGDKEWVELFNDSSQPADVGGLQIDDIDGGSTPLIIPDGTVIPALGFLVFTLESKFNNEGDSVRLLNPNGSVIETGDYQNSIEEVSYAKTAQNNWAQTSTPTPNGPNQITAPTTLSLTKNPTTTSKTNTPALKINPTIKQTSNLKAVLGTESSSLEASAATTHIKLSFNDTDESSKSSLVKGDSYSKYLSYGLIGIGLIILIIPLVVFLKKKYA